MDFLILYFCLTSASMSYVLALTTLEGKAVEAEISDHFTATVDCSEWYKTGEKIICQFSITNNHPMNHYNVLKWFTPLEGLKYSFATVSKGNQDIPYDGVMIKRGNPRAMEYQLLRARHTIKTNIDLSVAYAMEETGKYTVHLKTQLFYHLEIGNAASADVEQTLESASVTFHLMEGNSPRKTLGELHRHEDTDTQQAGPEQSGDPLNSYFVSGTAAQRLLTKEIHRAMYHYVSAAGDDIDDNQPHYISWFGALNPVRVQQVKQIYQGMKNALERDIISYIFNDPDCKPNVYAFTYKGSRKIWLCNMYLLSDDILGIDTKLCTLVHELSHAVMNTNDYAYGRQSCLNLAKTNPNKAINNGNSYCYHSETTNIFDYGFDAMTAWTTNEHTYVTRGNTYLRYSDHSASRIDDGYPKLIKGNWGTLPDSFVAGIDSMIGLRIDEKEFITKGNHWVRYTGDILDRGPYPFLGWWGPLTGRFAFGMDSMAQFQNGKVYVTKGNQYLRYSNPLAERCDSGYPKRLQWNWGILPASFARSFDSMALLRNEKVYVTKGKQYIRYSSSAAIFDPGYPLPIRGNWGKINFPGPQ